MYKLMCKDNVVMTYDEIENSIDVIREELLHPAISPTRASTFLEFINNRGTAYRVSSKDNYWVKRNTNEVNYDSIKVPRKLFKVNNIIRDVIDYVSYNEDTILTEDYNFFSYSDLTKWYMESDESVTRNTIVKMLDYVLGTNGDSDSNTGALYDSTTGKFVQISPLYWRYSYKLYKHSKFTLDNEKTVLMPRKIPEYLTYINRMSEAGVEVKDFSTFTPRITKALLNEFEKQDRKEYPKDLLNALFIFNNSLIMNLPE